MKSNNILSKSMVLTLFIPLCLLTSFKFDLDDCKSKPGVYATYDDFTQGKITDYGYIEFMDYNKVNFKKDGKRTIFRFKYSTIWGFKDSVGNEYRIRKSDFCGYKIITKGKVTLYGDMMNTFIHKLLCNTTSVTVFVSYGDLSKYVMISKSQNGEMLECTTQNLLTVFADDPYVVSLIKKNPISKRIKDQSTLDKDFQNIKQWVDLYNLTTH
jgi:hypothetical protein